MVIMYDESESLKALLWTLRKTALHSLEDIDQFQKSWKKDIETYEYQQRENLSAELLDAKQLLDQFLENFEVQLAVSKQQLNVEKEELPRLIHQIKIQLTANPILGLKNRIKVFFLHRRLNQLKVNFEHEAQRPLKKLRKQIRKQQQWISATERDFEQIVTKRSKKYIKQINDTKRILDLNYSNIAGAIGETRAIQELQKLPDSYVLFNDLQYDFNPPIYNRREKDRIRSIQVDHLVVGPTGVFVIETKHWSEASIQNRIFYSPVKQVRRAAFAIFVALNEQIRLPKYLGGRKKIPVKSVLLMTNIMPNQQAQYVKILSLDRLISYIMYGDQVWTEKEVQKMVSFFR